MMRVTLVIHDAPRTGAVLFADALYGALHRLVDVERQSSSAASGFPTPAGSFVVANSLAALSGLKACNAVIAHEHPWWLTLHPDVVMLLRTLRPHVFVVSPSAGRLITSLTDLRVIAVPRCATPSNPMVRQIETERHEPQRSLRLLGSGTVSLTKGVDLWLQVVNALSVELPVIARWVGTVPNRRYATEMLADVERFGLSKLVSFEGLVDDVGPYYRWADAFIVTSRCEAYCVSIDEARTQGTPVFAFGGAFDAERIDSCDALWVDNFHVPRMVQALRAADLRRSDRSKALPRDVDIDQLAHAIVGVAREAAMARP